MLPLPLPEWSGEEDAMVMDASPSPAPAAPAAVVPPPSTASAAPLLPVMSRIASSPAAVNIRATMAPPAPVAAAPAAAAVAAPNMWQRLTAAPLRAPTAVPPQSQPASAASSRSSAAASGPPPPSYFDEFDSPDLSAEELCADWAAQLRGEFQSTRQTDAKPAAAAAAAASSYAPARPAASAAAAAAASSASSRASVPAGAMLPISTTSSTLFKRGLELLQQYFGYASFRDGQWQAIEAIMQGKDCFLLMGTGSGKSLCFQLPPLLSGKPLIVISPLISLMHDQVLGLEARGIRSCALTSDESDAGKFRGVMDGHFQIVYMSPERLRGMIPNLLQLEQRGGLCAFAVDESHCVSEWGHDFRSAYRELGVIRANFPSVPILALTATATPQVSRDIENQLCLRSTVRIQTTFNRPNLYLDVRMASTPRQDLTRELLGNGRQSCIIYTQTKAETESIALHLKSLGIDAAAYHAAVSPPERKRIHTDFISERLRVIVATVAFGMGVDYAETRKVINYGQTKSLESLVQMSGRAGRDGQPAECILFYRRSDAGKAMMWKRGAEAERNGGGQAWNSAEHERNRSIDKMMSKMQEYVQSIRCRRQMILEYFSENWRDNAPPAGTVKGVIGADGNCMHCDNCMAALRMKAEAASPSGASSSSSAPSVSSIDPTHMYWIAQAVSETGGRFGASFIVTLLKGGNSKKLTERDGMFRGGVAALKSYGALKAESTSYLNALIKFLPNISVTSLSSVTEYPIVKLGSEGRILVALGLEGCAAFRAGVGAGNLTPELTDEIRKRTAYLEQKEKSKAARSLAAQQSHEAAAAYNSSLITRATADPQETKLLEALVALRSTVAKARNIPPYVVFSRNELELFAKYRPVTTEWLASLAGVTHVKAQQYGKEFCEAIRKHCEEHDMKTNLPVPVGQTQAGALVEAPATGTSSSSGSVMTYTQYLSRVHGATAADQISSVACSWHPLPPGPLTRVFVSEVSASDVKSSPMRDNIWALWMDNHSIASIAQQESKEPAAVVKYLAESLESGAAYEWARFNVSDAAVQEVQSAILRAEAAGIRAGSAKYLSDKCGVGLWPVPYLRQIHDELPELFHRNWPLIQLTTTHLRRLYGVSGPPRATHTAPLSTPAAASRTAVAAAAAAAHPVVASSAASYSDDDDEPLSSFVPKPPASAADLSRFLSKNSPVKVQQKEEPSMWKPRSVPTSARTPVSAGKPSAPAPAAAAAAATGHAAGALPLPRRSLSDVIAAGAAPAAASVSASSAPVAAAAPAVVSSVLVPLYTLPFAVDVTRSLTKQKIKTLETFVLERKSVSQISASSMLRASSIVSFLSDALLHGYELSTDAFHIPAQDVEAVYALLPDALGPLDRNAMELLVRKPVAALIPTILSIKQRAREECTREMILVLIHQFLQRKLQQLFARSPVQAVAAPAAAKVESSDGEEEFVVERIVGQRTNKKQRTEYKVRWSGFSSAEDTWEPEETVRELAAFDDWQRKIKHTTSDEPRGSPPSATTDPASLPPLELPAPLNLLPSPVPAHATSDGASPPPAVSGVKRKATDEGVADAVQQEREKLQKVEEDAVPLECALRDASPQSAMEIDSTCSPSSSSQSRVAGGKHVLATHPIQLLSNGTRSEAKTEVPSTVPLALNSASILELLTAAPSGLLAADIGQQLIPLNGNVWKEMAKMQGMLDAMVSEERITKDAAGRYCTIHAQ